MSGGRIVGSVVAAVLTIVAWSTLGVVGFGPRLLVAFVAFGASHGVVALVRGRSTTTDDAAPRSRDEKGSNAPLWIAGAAAAVVALAFGGLAIATWRQKKAMEEEVQAREQAFVKARDEAQAKAQAHEAGTATSGEPARAATIGITSWGATVVGPFDASVVQQLAAKGFEPAGQSLDWNDVRPEELATVGAAPKDIADLTMRCAKGTTNLSALAALASLRRLSLLECPEIDVTTLATIVGLKELRLHDVPITSFSFVRDMKALEVLDASASMDLRIGAEIAKLSGRAKPGDVLYTMTEMQPLAVVDTSDLSALASLKKLTLSTRAVKDLLPLSSLHALEYLNIDETPVMDLAPLKTLSSLKVLDAADSPASDLSPIGELASLTDLWLRGAAAKEFSFLSRLSNLEDLEITVTDFHDLSAVVPLTKLRKLMVDFTKVTDWSPLRRLASRATIEALGVGGTSFSDLSLIAGMPKLGFLAVGNCTLKNAQALGTLPSLDHLYMSEAKGIDAAAFRKAHPKVTVDD